jgi:cytochrome c
MYSYRFALAIGLFALFGLVSGATSAWAGDPAAGQRAFNKCRACHVADRETNRVGPHLVGIVGRAAGSVDGFKYSDAMLAAAAAGLAWDAATIAAYLKDPKGFIPGNRMIFPGLKDDTEIANLIAYLGG